MTAPRKEIPEAEIGYVLIGGLVVSVVVILFGILGYLVQSGSTTIEYTVSWQMTGTDFFSYLWRLLESLSMKQAPTETMAFGIVLLMLTSYVRVFATAVLFAASRNVKYLVISLVVFVLLTLTLLTH